MAHATPRACDVLRAGYVCLRPRPRLNGRGSRCSGADCAARRRCRGGRGRRDRRRSSRGGRGSGRSGDLGSPEVDVTHAASATLGGRYYLSPISLQRNTDRDHSMGYINS